MTELTPIKQIVHATDFSDNATVALEWAVEIARAHGARLHVIHGVDAVSAGHEVPPEMRDGIAGSLAALAAIASGVEVTTEHRAGRPWKIVRDVAAERAADLIVVGARGQTSFAHLLVGSTADRILRTAGAPVLTVHPERRERKRLKTILVATDFSEAARAAMEFAARLAGVETPLPRIVLLHAWQSLVAYEFGLSTPGASPLDTDDEQARAVLVRHADALRDRGFDVEAVLRPGYPAAVVRKEAEAIGADLIAAGTHGRPGLERFMLGSIAERIVHHAACPVLTTRAVEVAASATSPDALTSSKS